MTKRVKKAGKLVDFTARCVDIMMYNLKLFGNKYENLSTTDLILNEMKPDPSAQDSDVNVHVLSVETPEDANHIYVQMIFHLSESGIMSYLLSSIKNIKK